MKHTHGGYRDGAGRKRIADPLAVGSACEKAHQSVRKKNNTGRRPKGVRSRILSVVARKFRVSPRTADAHWKTFRRERQRKEGTA